MNTRLKLAALAAVIIPLSACGPDAGENQELGTLLGAVVGGLAGAQVGDGDGQLVAIGVGVLLGSLIGGDIGRTMDAVDRQLMAETTQNTLHYEPIGNVIKWQNPDDPTHSGTVVVNSTQQVGDTFCREFQQTVTIGGQEEAAFGTACLMPDDTWQIQQAGG